MTPAPFERAEHDNVSDLACQYICTLRAHGVCHSIYESLTRVPAEEIGGLLGIDEGGDVVGLHHHDWRRSLQRHHAGLCVVMNCDRQQQECCKGCGICCAPDLGELACESSMRKVPGDLKATRGRRNLRDLAVSRSFLDSSFRVMFPNLRENNVSCG